MKTKMIFLAFCMTIMFCMSACAGTTKNTSDDQGAVNEVSASENKAAEDEAIGDSTMIMKIGDTKVNVDWEDNQAVKALRNMVEKGDVIIQMSMYGGFEQVGSIGQSLPRNDKQTTTSSGDIVLYSGNQMVVFYGSNSWSYTRLGHISDKDEAGMTELLSNGDVTITISMGQGLLKQKYIGTKTVAISRKIYSHYFFKKLF